MNLEKRVASSQTDSRTSIDNDMGRIKSLWDNMGVSIYYRQVFETVINDLDHVIKKDFLEFEFVNLKKVYDHIIVNK